ncbi:MAG: HAD family hydrolase [Halodesulfurarchaeum sp.]
MTGEAGGDRGGEEQWWRGREWWTQYEGVVFDLDGTLVRLAVDWDQVDEELGALLDPTGVDPGVHEHWEQLDAAQEAGVGEEAETIITEHELAGAEGSRRLPLADRLPEIDRPVGVVSLNAEAPVTRALEIHGLLDQVDVVVGRDSVPERKPAPEPLFAALAALGVAPDSALFVGDSAGDEETARRAGVCFKWV